MGRNFIFWSKFYDQNFIFGPNFNFWRKFYFLTKILFFDENFIFFDETFWGKFYFFTKIFHFSEKICYLTKILTLKIGHNWVQDEWWNSLLGGQLYWPIFVSNGGFERKIATCWNSCNANCQVINNTILKFGPPSPTQKNWNLIPHKFEISTWNNDFFSKFEEIYAPEVSEFVFITDDTYTRQQVLRMEHLMIKVKHNISKAVLFQGPHCNIFNH